MIIVTGTKRSGTSMWMQILAAAGLPVFGEAFPRSWRCGPSSSARSTTTTGACVSWP